MSGMTAAIHRRTSHIGKLLGLLALTIGLILGPATPARAHAVLVSSSPVPDVVLSSAPAEVVLTFSESVRQVPGKIRVLAPDGSRVDRGEPTFTGAVVSIPVDPTGPKGTYLVSYRVISADGHPVSGGYTYSVGTPSAPPADTGDADGDPVVSAALAVTRYLGFAGLLLLVGPVLVLSLLWPRRLDRRGPAKLVWIGIALVAISTLAGLLLQVPYTTGGGLFSVTGDGLRDVLGSTFGAAYLVRLGILAAAVILLHGVLRQPTPVGSPADPGDESSGPSPGASASGSATGRADRVLLVILGVAGLVTWPLAGHPAASPIPAVSVVVDTVHLGAMAVWLGGLTMLAGFLLRRANERELGAILPVWSRWAATAVTALLVAGTVQALIEVSPLDAIFTTGYGQRILVKLGLVGLVIVVATFSRRLVLRQQAAGQPQRLRRLVWAELAITAIVLAVTATLVQTTPTRAAVAEERATNYFATRLTSSLYQLQVEVDPARTGVNSVHLYAYTPDNKPLPVVEWRATAALPERDVEPIDVPLLKLTDNHAFGEISLPTSGDWKMRFTVRISDIDQATVTATVPIT